MNDMLNFAGGIIIACVIYKLAMFGKETGSLPNRVDNLLSLISLLLAITSSIWIIFLR